MYERKDYFAALHLAGAGEEIMGKYLEAAGGMPSLKSQTHAIVGVKKMLYGVDMFEKDAKTLLNKPKNTIKHMNDRAESTVSMDPKYESEDMLGRAFTNLIRLDLELSPSMMQIWGIIEGS